MSGNRKRTQLEAMFHGTFYADPRQALVFGVK